MSVRELRDETIGFMERRGLRVEDVAFCQVERKGKPYQFTFDTFYRSAGFKYDAGYGGQKVEATLKIVFKDGSWMERGEYDGAEWWEFRACPVRQEVVYDFKKVDLRERFMDDYSDEISKLEE